MREGLRVVSGFANEMCQVIANTDPTERNKAMASLNSRFGAGLQMSVQQTREIIAKTSDELADVAAILRVNPEAESLLPLVCLAGRGAMAAKESGIDVGATTASLPELLLREGNGAGSDMPDAADAQAILAAGIQDIRNSLVDDVPLNDILRIILETTFAAPCGFEHVLLCLRDGKSNAMVGHWF